AAGESGRSAQCTSNLRGIGLALVNFQTSKGYFPYAARPNEALPLDRRMSWLFDVLPYLFCLHCWGINDLSEIDPSGPWDTGAQRRLSVLPLEPLLCPSAPFHPAHGTHSGLHYVDRSQLSDPVPLAYVGITGVGKDAALLPKGDPKAGVFG